MRTGQKIVNRTCSCYNQGEPEDEPVISILEESRVGGLSYGAESMRGLTFYMCAFKVNLGLLEFCVEK